MSYLMILNFTYESQLFLIFKKEGDKHLHKFKLTIHINDLNNWFSISLKLDKIRYFI